MRRVISLGLPLAIVAMLMTAPTALAAKKGVYAGRVKLGEPIVLTADAKGQKITSAVLALEMQCLDGSLLPPYAAAVEPAMATPGFEPGPGDLVMSKNAKGKFAGTILTGMAGDQYSVAAVITLNGKLAKGVATGTLKGEATVYDETNGGQEVTTCSTGGSKFTASRKASYVYGGATTQGEPIVLRLNGSRTKITDFLFSWQAACDQADWGGYHLGIDGFMKVPLTHAGSFAINSSPLYERADGGKNVFDYKIKGKISKTAAKGTLTLSYTSFDSAGTREGGCNAGPLSFKALTG